MHRTDEYSQYSSIIWPVWLNAEPFSKTMIYRKKHLTKNGMKKLLNYKYTHDITCNLSILNSGSIGIYKKDQ